MFEYVLEDKETYLLAKGRGDTADHAEWKSKAEKLLKETSVRGFKRLLVDRLDVELKVDAYDIVTVADHLTDLGLHQLGLRIAVVTREDNALFCMLETIMTNRSFAYRVFRDYDSAEQWLLHG